MRRMLLIVTILFGLARLLCAEEPLELKEGDRVVFLGNTLIEAASRSTATGNYC